MRKLIVALVFLAPFAACAPAAPTISSPPPVMSATPSVSATAAVATVEESGPKAPIAKKEPLVTTIHGIKRVHARASPADDKCILAVSEEGAAKRKNAFLRHGCGDPQGRNVPVHEEKDGMDPLGVRHGPDKNPSLAPRGTRTTGEVRYTPAD